MDIKHCEECGNWMYNTDYTVCYDCYIDSLDVAIDGE